MGFSISDNIWKSYDSWKTTPPDDPPVACKCQCCNCDIYEGETIYEIGDEIWCEDCIDNCRKEAELEEEY